MFKIFKRKGGKAEDAGNVERTCSLPASPVTPRAVDVRPPNDATDEQISRKHVVNLLLPVTDYNNQKTGVGAILQIMAGKRRRNKRKSGHSDSFRTPQNQVALQRSKSDVESRRTDDVCAPTDAKNNQDALETRDDPADFVKALVLQKYANKSNTDAKHHVSRVYLTEPDLEEKRHAESLLREIAKSIDCTLDLNDNKEMGNADSKPGSDRKSEHVYEYIDDRNNEHIESYKNDLKNELEKLAQQEAEKEDEKQNECSESPAFIKKSNLKVPKSDTEGCSDDDRSDCGKKKVTFRKHIIFDDGEQQTDEEMDSSFESLTSEEEEEEYLEDSLPDNDELLGGVVVSRNDEIKTVIQVTADDNDDSHEVQIEISDDKGLKRVSSDNSDSGFIEISDKQNESGDDLTSEVKSLEVEESESEVSESETDEEVVEEIEEVIEVEEISEDEQEPEQKPVDMKALANEESKFTTDVSTLCAIETARCGEAERARQLLVACRECVERQQKELPILQDELAAAYKELELVKQRSRSLEEELTAARTCSANLAEQLQKRNDDSLRQLQSELEDAVNRISELESKVLSLEREKDRLLEEKAVSEQKAHEALVAAEANTAKWRSAHEAARSQAATRAERIMADCEWKMRELEKRARDVEKENKELTQKIEKLKSAPNPTHLAELTQLRGIVSEQQRSVHSLTLQLQKVETREEALKLEVHRLKELLEKEIAKGREKEEKYEETIKSLSAKHAEQLESLKSSHASSWASSRAALERSHAERTRAALAQLREENHRETRNNERKLREVTQRLENLKEVLAAKESQFEHDIAEAHSKADWDIMQLRHLLDKTDISYANKVEEMNERFEKEKERLNEEWRTKVEELEEKMTENEEEAAKLLESTRSRLTSEKIEQINKLKESHRLEMDEQWEQFMIDKETCLTRMKAECRQEGDEERVKREKELLEEIAELRAQLQSKSVDFDHLAVKAAACGRTLAVTEQELREALAREKDLREKRSEDATKIKKAERSAKDQVEHLTRKCACLRKLFDDMRARLATREKTAEENLKAKEKEIVHLRAEVARLTRLLVQQDTSQLGTRTRADGCENILQNEENFLKNGDFSETQQSPRRKGGTQYTPEPYRKQRTQPLAELQPLPPEARRNSFDSQHGRRRKDSVELPAVQVPTRIKQLEERK